MSPLTIYVLVAWAIMAGFGFAAGERCGALRNTAALVARSDFAVIRGKLKRLNQANAGGEERLWIDHTCA